MPPKSSLATVTTIAASLVTVIGATLLMMYVVRFQRATGELALIGAAMSAAGLAILWWQWKR
jgi:UDP-N-acetylmuramyl pentapeptide phosphotransferase/UDP-N-acetylglucosamine-1-phosphate transferase